MSKLTQAELEHKSEVFITNGQLPQAQSVIGKVGCTALVLKGKAALLAEVQNGHVVVPQANQMQKHATDVEALAKRASQKEITSLNDTCRTIFRDDEPTLTALGLTTQYETKAGPEGQPSIQVAVRPSNATSEVLKRWRSRLGVALELEESKAAALAEAGWDKTRLQAAQQKVEAYAAADTNQQVARAAHQQATGQHTSNVDALRAWYTTAAALSRRAIKDADPENHLQLLELLEL